MHEYLIDLSFDGTEEQAQAIIDAITAAAEQAGVVVEINFP